MKKTHGFHFLESGDVFLGLPRGEGVEGDGLDVGDDGLDGIGHEGAEDELAELGVVVALVEEDGLLSEHPLLAGGECGLEEVGIGDEDLLRRLRAGDHHAGAAQYVALEYRPVPAQFQ